jgi:hypothetical protein
MLEIQREVPTFSHAADDKLAFVIHRMVHGEATAVEVTAALRRLCGESRTRPPELMLLRIKELWTKVAGVPRAGRDDCDRRYYTFIGEALALYFESSPAPVTARRPTYAAQTGCGEPEGISPG